MLNAIESIAPALTKALLGPIGSLAIGAASSIATALGISDHTQESVKNALLNIELTPEQKLSLTQAENNFKISIAQVYAENFKTEVQDAEDARKREVDLANSKWGWMSLSIMNIAGFNMLLLLDLLTFWVCFEQGDPQLQTMVLTFDLTSAVAWFLQYIWGKYKKDD